MCNSRFNQTISDSSLARFNNYMDSKESGRDCNCLADCEQEVRFETQVSFKLNINFESGSNILYLNKGVKVKSEP